MKRASCIIEECVIAVLNDGYHIKQGFTGFLLLYINNLYIPPYQEYPGSNKRVILYGLIHRKHFLVGYGGRGAVRAEA